MIYSGDFDQEWMASRPLFLNESELFDTVESLVRVPIVVVIKQIVIILRSSAELRRVCV